MQRDDKSRAAPEELPAQRLSRSLPLLACDSASMRAVAKLLGLALLALAGVFGAAAWEDGREVRIGVFVHDAPFALLDEAGNITGEPAAACDPLRLPKPSAGAAPALPRSLSALAWGWRGSRRGRAPQGRPRRRRRRGWPPGTPPPPPLRLAQPLAFHGWLPDTATCM